jgi:hypothetical protein
MSVWVVCTDTKCVTTLIVPATAVLILVRGSMCPAVSYLSSSRSVGKLPKNQYNTKVSLCRYLQNSSPLTGMIRKQQHLEWSTTRSKSYYAAKRSQRRVNTVKTNASIGTCEWPRVSQNCWYTLQNWNPHRKPTYVSSTAARTFLPQNPSMERISTAHLICGLCVHIALDKCDSHEQPHTK